MANIVGPSFGGELDLTPEELEWLSSTGGFSAVEQPSGAFEAMPRAPIADRIDRICETQGMLREVCLDRGKSLKIHSKNPDAPAETVLPCFIQDSFIPVRSHAYHLELPQAIQEITGCKDLNSLINAKMRTNPEVKLPQGARELDFGLHETVVGSFITTQQERGIGRFSPEISFTHDLVFVIAWDDAGTTFGIELFDKDSQRTTASYKLKMNNIDFSPETETFSITGEPENLTIGNIFDSDPSEAEVSCTALSRTHCLNLFILPVDKIKKSPSPASIIPDSLLSSVSSRPTAFDSLFERANSFFGQPEPSASAGNVLDRRHGEFDPFERIEPGAFAHQETHELSERDGRTFMPRGSHEQFISAAPASASHGTPEPSSLEKPKRLKRHGRTFIPHEASEPFKIDWRDFDCPGKPDLFGIREEDFDLQRLAPPESTASASAPLRELDPFGMHEEAFDLQRLGPPESATSASAPLREPDPFGMYEEAFDLQRLGPPESATSASAPIREPDPFGMREGAFDLQRLGPPERATSASAPIRGSSPPYRTSKGTFAHLRLIESPERVRDAFNSAPFGLPQEALISPEEPDPFEIPERTFASSREPNQFVLPEGAFASSRSAAARDPIDSNSTILEQLRLEEARHSEEDFLFVERGNTARRPSLIPRVRPIEKKLQPQQLGSLVRLVLQPISSIEEDYIERGKKALDHEMSFQAFLRNERIRLQTSRTVMSSNIPVRLRCPITERLLEDPVRIGNSRYVVSRAIIEQWISAHRTNPFTQKPVEISDLIPDAEIARAIKKWKKRQPVSAAAAAAAAAASSATEF